MFMGSDVAKKLTGWKRNTTSLCWMNQHLAKCMSELPLDLDVALRTSTIKCTKALMNPPFYKGGKPESC